MCRIHVMPHHFFFGKRKRNAATLTHVDGYVLYLSIQAVDVELQQFEMNLSIFVDCMCLNENTVHITF